MSFARRSRPRWVRLIAAAALAVITALAATTVANSGAAAGSPATHRPLASVFSVLRSAHAAAAAQAPAEPLAGAATVAFAATFPGGDQTFVAAMTDGDVCLINQVAPGTQPAPPGGSGIMAVACSYPANAEADGVSLIAPGNSASTSAAITLLVPNGISTVTFSTVGGGETVAPVQNSVARAVGDLVSATFTTSTGASVTYQVPGAPGAAQ